MKQFLTGLLVGAVLFVPATTIAQNIYDKTISVGRFGETNMSIERFDDPDFQVKCWKYRDGYGGGLSCLPWSQVEER